MQIISPFLIGSNPPANSSQPTGASHFLEDASNIPSNQWHICLETRLINGIFAWKSALAIVDLKKMEFTAIKDQVAEFFTKTERRQSKNTQDILLDGCYLLFEEYLHGKKHRFYILNCAEK